MSNNLDRHIAVVTHTTPNNLSAILNEFECLPRFFEPAMLNEINAHDFDGILFDDVEVELGPPIQKALREMHEAFKPIAVIGQSANMIANFFGETVELALKEGTPASDYISDRDFKVLSTAGTDVAGIRRMLRELIEMA